MISYKLFDPAGNITAIVDDTERKLDRAEEAGRILKAEPSCEQVGFLSLPQKWEDVCLEMAGGEFCGNAVFAAATHFAEEKGLFTDEAASEESEPKTVRVTVSGSEVLDVSVSKTPEGFECSYRFPDMLGREEIDGIKVFHFDGISHAVLWDPLPKSEAEALVKTLCIKTGKEAFGLMFIEAQTLEIKPLVFVRDPETLYWENSCASGSAAVALALADYWVTPFDAKLWFPGGTIQIAVSPDNSVELKEFIKI